MKASLQIKNSNYYVVISYKDIDGKHKVKWISSGLKEGAAKRKLEEVRKNILKDFEEQFNIKRYALPSFDSGNRNMPAARYKFTDFMNNWMEITRPSVSYTTYSNYKRIVKAVNTYFEPLGLMLDEVRPIHIQNFYNSLYARGLSANSVLHYHANIRKALQYAVTNDFVPSNAADKIVRPKKGKYSASFYNKEELLKLFGIIEGDQIELCVHIAAYYGLRRSEILGLKWDAIDFENKRITIRHKVVHGYENGKEVLICEDKLKSLSSHRTLPLIPHIEKMLLAEKEAQEKNAALLRSGYNKKYDGYVCRNATGDLISPDYLTSHFRHVVDKNKLRHIRFHDLRHSCASLMLANGVPMKQIQEWLGHSTFNMTADLYSHLEFSSKIASAAAIENALG